MKKLFVLFLSLIVILAACGSKEDEKTVKIGVTGVDSKVWDVVKKEAEKDGIKIEFVEFQDYTAPNNALAEGEIDLNAFQHFAFLDQFKKDHKLKLSVVGTTVFAPLGAYTKKIQDIKDVKKGDTIAIPDDVTNQARALKLLEQAGLIKLSSDFGLFGGPDKIEENKLDLKIKPIDAQQTPRVLEDVAVSIINNGVAARAGLNPKDDPIYLEDADNKDVAPYINVIAAKTEDKDNKTYKKIVELYHSDLAKDALKEDTKDGEIAKNLSQDEINKIEEGLK
ncbi:MetQ/NlpA family ABC transporter substrate-binding protein [Macrococcoides bohemicum]|uniref:Lipoprotein n=1 Tax=Macrococcoides bohemicum TaxID=1903056 RepID=A0AAE7QAS8_9STAP|nr:MetQ/NlpA family ABC transporter substrate-binding protein [Macrococcus bohemicus]QRN49208.1 MetQ/NlpA family ABC transporter substrate-binding protein [Macrococcus bohemicus]QYA42978.1 MetQ/NlpA family ABC transporter substrate-binding protein [Macrococcus bohemicus]QYA45329.1 MetQ/NlpA family ABC transporter substrate-binding protein [Macrococcus bohemicus]